MTVDIHKVHAVIDDDTQEYIKKLAEMVTIKGVSAQAACRAEVVKTAHWIETEIKKDWPQAEVRLEIPDEKQILEGQELSLPPIVVAQTAPLDDKKRTLLVYAHYDVQPAEREDGWETEPFELVKLDNGQLRGRGSTDDKGPLLGWLGALRAYKKAGIDVPVNIKFLFEGMEESGSDGMDEIIGRLKSNTKFLEGVDFVCISDNYWFTTSKPCLTHGLRGMVSAQVTITGPKRDLHSGVYGGCVYQPLDDLIYIMSSLKDKDDKILIPGVCDTVAPVTEEELERIKKVTFFLDQRRDEVGTTRLRHEDDIPALLMSTWRNPSLSLHGIEGAFAEPGFKTVIPMKVTGKFSIRIVPNQDPDTVAKQVEDYVKQKMAERDSPNQMSLVIGTGRWWFTEPTNKVFEAAKKATEQVHSVTPDFTREGGSIPITLTLGECTGAPVCLLPMGRSDDSPHSQNEKLDVSNYVQGMKTFASFLNELSVV
eukprot:Blabericola_migrator_1__11138@NODE_651_length_7047_cov_201_880372_g477_i0_p2_GENE_NODE_651_length_7047_cov_201_880372_g477_i0NODE_651_length_7047_cov_201_880372_g477_i0_p2_ORF_typecomplete_len481_score117_27Peptidase_M20/PF01546_28/4_1e48M20_dimer/PF07687_14/9_7e03M20_dimer/PF07687_14/4e23Peptidase_M28/PF04389_17/0_00015_NODE_651_length_7047_cov_201_880372_g477_i041055547